MVRVNQYNQEIGDPVKDWKARSLPDKVTLEGNHCILEPLNDEKHSSDLFEAYSQAEDGRMWTYVPIGPFNDLGSYKIFVSNLKNTNDKHFAVISKSTGRAVGTLCLMRADNLNGAVEVGFVIFSQDLQQTIMSTEAHYLLMKYVFDDLKYRRYEWKCDSLNAPSKRAAMRLGFQFEGTFRQVQTYKGRNRDTAWLSVIDQEWPVCRESFEQWLKPANFENGKQKKGLREIREAILQNT